jgi:DNA transformation protein
MAKTTAFVEHLRELLSLTPGITIRPMFGGFGVSHGGKMVGIIDDDVLYLKVDDETRARFDERKLPPFSYPSKKGPMEMPQYRRAPDECVDDAETLREWLKLSIAVVARGKVKQRAPAKHKAATKKKK